ncbi:MAG: suppressor of fused domain protein [Cardiobacteriaceae bacterium]|nr:suppressor of fused domain protein [Cardiobacteriaceae bacterium]
MKTYENVIFRHIHNFWSDAEIEKFSWNNGKIITEMPYFKVFCVQPKDRNYAIYISSGIATIINQEFFIISPYKSEEHIETLAMIASASIAYPNSFQLNCCVNIDKPWLDNSKLKYFLISLPYTFGQNLEYMEFGNKKIRFFWLLPITDEEHSFLQNHSVGSLEDLFEANNIDYLNINRKSVV